MHHQIYLHCHDFAILAKNENVVLNLNVLATGKEKSLGKSSGWECRAGNFARKQRSKKTLRGPHWKVLELGSTKGNTGGYSTLGSKQGD